LTGDFDVPLGLFLQAATPRDIIARLLRNLKEIHRTDEDWGRLLPVMNRLVVLLPEAVEERRDRGLAWAESGHPIEAIADLDSYLRQRPHAEDRFVLVERLAHLRRDLPPRLH
jgi:regulator of sirC expression with transglutaminase-like and TPR domain